MERPNNVPELARRGLPGSSNRPVQLAFSSVRQRLEPGTISRSGLCIICTKGALFHHGIGHVIFHRHADAQADRPSRRQDQGGVQTSNLGVDGETQKGNKPDRREVQGDGATQGGHSWMKLRGCICIFPVYSKQTRRPTALVIPVTLMTAITSTCADCTLTMNQNLSQCRRHDLDDCSRDVRNEI